MVLGLGLSGNAAAELAAQTGADVDVLDEGHSATLEERAEALARRGVRVHLDWHDTQWQGTPQAVVMSPGIPSGSCLGRLAAGMTCPVISELEFAFRYCSCPVVAVTGTNGKSTTVELITHCLKGCGRRAALAGNIGIPLSGTVPKTGTYDYVVVEVSSFQLERIRTFEPLMAVLLNLSPDHLDRYDTAQDYYRAKFRLFANMTRRRNAVLHHDLLDAQDVMSALPSDDSTPATFSLDADSRADVYLRPDGVLCQRCGEVERPFVQRSDLRLAGNHNLENVLAAAAVCTGLGVDPMSLARPLKTFAPSPHRLELVAAHDGIRYIDDSKATNPDALCRAVAAVGQKGRKNVLLLAGGLNKGLDFAAAAERLQPYVREAFLMGRCRDQLAAQWGTAMACKSFVSLAGAVDAALESAVSGDTVLLSPGCASQDMFANYAERGAAFTELIKRRIGQ